MGNIVKKISRSLTLAMLVAALCAVGQRAEAEPISLQWPQPGGPGTPVAITYSYSNLLDGTLRMLSPAELKGATEEALGLWAGYAPLHFFEKPDSGPPPSDISYSRANHPQLRIGHHPMADLAHAYLPDAWNGLAGDVHFNSTIVWTLGATDWNFLEVVTHELGHSVGLGHEDEREAIMNAIFPQRRFGGLGTGFLLPADINGLQALYGAGTGSVHPMDPVPEPATILLVATGVALMARRRRRRA